MKRKIETGTVVRTIVLTLALINQILAAIGKSPLPFSEEEAGQAASAAITAAASLAAWWKNNSFTQTAIAADELLELMRR